MRPRLATLCLLAISDLEQVLFHLPADDTVGLSDMRLHIAAWTASYRRHWRTRR